MIIIQRYLTLVHLRPRGLSSGSSFTSFFPPATYLLSTTATFPSVPSRRRPPNPRWHLFHTRLDTRRLRTSTRCRRSFVSSALPFCCLVYLRRTHQDQITPCFSIHYLAPALAPPGPSVTWVHCSTAELFNGRPLESGIEHLLYPLGYAGDDKQPVPRPLWFVRCWTESALPRSPKVVSTLLGVAIPSQRNGQSLAPHALLPELRSASNLSRAPATLPRSVLSLYPQADGPWPYSTFSSHGRTKTSLDVAEDCPTHPTGFEQGRQ